MVELRGLSFEFQSRGAERGLWTPVLRLQFDSSAFSMLLESVVILLVEVHRRLGFTIDFILKRFLNGVFMPVFRLLFGADSESFARIKNSHFVVGDLAGHQSPNAQILYLFNLHLFALLSVKFEETFAFRLLDLDEYIIVCFFPIENSY